MESKKQRFSKGSEEAKAYMAELRAKRKGNKGGGGSNTPPPPSPANCECPTTEKPIPKRTNNKNIIVDF